MDKLSTQTRVLIATLLSFAFFIAYDYFFIPKQPIVAEQNQTKQATSNQAPVSSNSNNTTGVTNTQPQTKNKTIVVVKAKSYEAHIDSLGRISSFYLNDKKYKNQEGENADLATLDPLPLEIRFDDKELNEIAFKNLYVSDVNEIDVSESSQAITLTQDLGDTKIVKTITFHPDGSYDLSVKAPNKPYFITPGIRPNVDVDSYTFHGVVLHQTDGTLDNYHDDDLKTNEVIEFDKDITIAAANDRYYTTLFYAFDNPLSVAVTADANKNSLVFVKANGDFNVKGYIGPKDYYTLKALSPKLTDIIEYGWFTFIARPMFSFLDFLHKYIGNWGWSIVVLTLIIRIILFPLTYKGMLSMNKLKELTPKIKELQAKYKGEPQKLNTHMMQLYKKHGANPMGGCLPILLQIPIFFAIYRVLLNSVQLKGAEWVLWIDNLALMDPYFILPIFMGLTMFIQQRLTPTSFTDPMQEKIMKFLPLIFTFFFVTFPAGLTLYWCVNNLCSIVQQLFVNKLFKNHKVSETKND